MKTLFLVSSILFFSSISRADSWDNLTLSQAKQVQKFLEKNPFIYDYCDCCSSEGDYLLKVISSKIVACEWDGAQYSVTVEAQRLALMQNTGSGLNNYHADPVPADEQFVQYTISMNYTFVYDKYMKWAVPFFKIIPHSNSSICVGAAVYIDPTGSSANISDADYAAWYLKNIKGK